MFAGAFGILLGTVGLDPMTPSSFTFGSVSLMNGISSIALMIGMFGVSEALLQIHHLNAQAVKQKIDRIVPLWGDIKRHLSLTLQSSGIGVIIGALPAPAGILLR